MPLTLCLVRHGQSSMNAGEWSDKPIESHLTALGNEQSKKAALAITEQPDLIIISPLVRAQESAEYLLDLWPKSPATYWPIQEFIYLSPTKLHLLDTAQRKQLIQDYWDRSDPFYCDNQDAESFDSFLKRVENFHLRIAKLEGFVVVIGHGQFFKAYLLGLKYGFISSTAWMKRYREEETKKPINNGEILKLFFEY
jgi:broad specificity phosphatase PhoE